MNCAPFGRSALTTAIVTVALFAPTAFGQVTIFVVDGSNNLLRFSSAAPQTILVTRPITGLQAGENLVGIDFRPATGGLYGVGSTSRLYLIDTTTGAATQVGTGVFSIPLNGTFFGVDFNPVSDRLRIVSDADVSIRVHPETAAITLDTPLTYAAGDANAGQNPSVDSIAYTNSVSGGAGTSTLFAIDVADRTLRVGGLDGIPSANGGLLNTVGALGVDTGVTCFDIGPDGVGYAALTPGGFSTLNTVDLTTGARTQVGPIGNLVVARGLAVAPVGAIEFAASSFAGVEGTTSAVITAQRIGGTFGEVSAQYATSDGSATAGVDYSAATGTITFEDGESERTFLVQVLNDSATEPVEEINLTLSQPTGGAVLGLRSTAVLSLVDNDLDFLRNLTCGMGLLGFSPFIAAAFAVARHRARRGRRVA